MRIDKYPDADLQRRSDLADQPQIRRQSNRAADGAGTHAGKYSVLLGLAAPKPIVRGPEQRCADVIAMMDTSAEFAAMADVQTPGHRPPTWYPYTKNFTKQSRRKSGRMGRRAKAAGSAVIS